MTAGRHLVSLLCICEQHTPCRSRRGKLALKVFSGNAMILFVGVQFVQPLLCAYTVGWSRRSVPFLLEGHFHLSPGTCVQHRRP